MNDMLFQITNPGVEEKAIQLLEDQFHFQMPWGMKSFYLKQNGVILSSGIKIDPEGCSLSFFHPIDRQYQKHVLTINKLLDWQNMDGFIPMCYIPFCSDEADDSYYIRVDKEGYGKVYYIFSEFLDEFLEDPDGNGYIAGSFTEFLEKLKIIS